MLRALANIIPGMPHQQQPDTPEVSVLDNAYSSGDSAGRPPLPPAATRQASRPILRCVRLRGTQVGWGRLVDRAQVAGVLCQCSLQLALHVIPSV